MNNQTIVDIFDSEESDDIWFVRNIVFNQYDIPQSVELLQAFKDRGYTVSNRYNRRIDNNPIDNKIWVVNKTNRESISMWIEFKHLISSSILIDIFGG